MKRLILITLTLLIASTLLAQYDVTKIYMQRARSFELRRQYDDANQMYRELLKENPDHAPAVENLIRNLLLQSKTEEAEAVLEQYGSALEKPKYVRNKLSIILRDNDFKRASKYAETQAKESPEDMLLLSELATVFEAYRDYDNAIRYLLLARDAAGTESAMHLELARVYQANGQYEEAIPELVTQLEENPGYFHYVNRKLKDMIMEKPDVVSIIRRNTIDSGNPLLIELYAQSLVEIGELDQAFAIYSDLAPDKLQQFANERLAAGDLELAQRAYNTFIDKTDDIFMKADASIMLAKIAIARDSLSVAENILQEIRANQVLQRGAGRYRIGANQLSRELLADIALIRQQPAETIIDYLNEAEQFTSNQREKNRLQFEIAHLYLMNEQYDQADRKIQETLRGQKEGSDAETMSFYYRYLSYLLQGDANADTLLNIMIIRDAGQENVNDALMLSQLTQKLEGEDRNLFFDAYRAFNLYRFDTALEKLQTLYEHTQNETFLIQAAEWAILSGKTGAAMTLLERDYTDEIAAGYAELRRLELTQDAQKRKDIAIMFLTGHDQSVFAPAIRGFVQTK